MHLLRVGVPPQALPAQSSEDGHALVHSLGSSCDWHDDCYGDPVEGEKKGNNCATEAELEAAGYFTCCPDYYMGSVNMGPVTSWNDSTWAYAVAIHARPRLHAPANQL